MKISNQFLSRAILSSLVALAMLGATACSCKDPSYRQLESKPSGSNMRYMQLIDPTPAQVAAGQLALEKFKTASKDERNELAGDLLISKVLLGMSAKDVQEKLGQAEFSSDPKLVTYDVARKEKLCQLLITVSLGKVSDVYIEAR